MNAKPQRNAQQTYLRSGTAKCPACGGSLIREHRRIVDRLQSLVTPLKRYRCDNFGCQWVGNIARKAAGNSASGVAHGIASQDGTDAPRRSVPAGFIVHMVLVAAGVVFVVLVSTMEPTPRPHESDPVPSSYFYAPAPQRSIDLTDSR